MDVATPAGTKEAERSELGRFFAIALGFWSGEARGRAWLITALVLAGVAAQITGQVFVNWWNKWFFDALEQKDVAGVWRYVLMLAPIALFSTVAGVFLIVARLHMQVRWREWMSRRLFGWWMADQRYYRLPFVAQEQTAPEYRISDDVLKSIEPLVEFGTGILTAFVTAATFAAILWSAAGSARVTIGSTTIEIPAYMALAAVLYAIFISGATWIAGKPLSRAVAGKNEIEAQFRAEMTRLRENSESIALIRGDDEERRLLHGIYDEVVGAWKIIVRRQGVIGIVLNFNAAMFSIIPLLLIAPKFLAGEISLGVVMQVASAFAAVQGALIWFVDNFIRLSEWYASVVRVNELTDALSDLDVGTIMQGDTTIERGPVEGGAILLEGLSVAHRSGQVIIAEASEKIAPGERVMIVGESGTGKSTLIRALAGLWPWGAGRIGLPEKARLAFLPQKPYMPKGPLRALLIYPLETQPGTDEELIEAMKACGLASFADRLDEEEDWDRVLSGGERQRVAFTRVLVQKPDIVIMDEATAALDEDSQERVLTLLRERLPEAAWISVGHRPSLDRFHDRKIVLERKPAGAELRRSPGRFERLRAAAGRWLRPPQDAQA